MTPVASETSKRRGRPAGKVRRPNLNSPIFEGYILPEQFAADSGRAESTVRRWIATGRVPVTEIGGIKVIPIAALHARAVAKLRTRLKPSRLRAAIGSDR